MPMPHRSPEFMGQTEKKGNVWQLHLQAPLYYEALQLFALDLTDHSLMVPIPHRLDRHDEKVTLSIDLASLKGSLHTDHRYRWIVVSKNSSATFLESDETFTWKN